MRLLVSVLLVTLLGFAPATPADEDFAGFWTRFKVALKKRDKAAIVAMTKLPFLYDSKNLQKAQFVAKIDEILPAKLSACFAKEKPVADKDAYSVFCGEQIYVFSKSNGRYLFSDIGVND